MVLLLEITKLKITQKPTRNVHYARFLDIRCDFDFWGILSELVEKIKL